MVPGGGIEPPQGFWPLRILSPLRLPISPSRLALILAHDSCMFFPKLGLTSHSICTFNIWNPGNFPSILV
jgi:hypothetical protein